MNPIKIRRTRRRDAEAIAHLAGILGRWILKHDRRTTAEDIRIHAFGPRRWCDILVACDEGRVVGYALYRCFFEGFIGHRRMFLSDLAVAPDARRGGIGEALMRDLARRSLALGCDALTCECSDNNASAMRFYAKHNAERINAVVTLCLDREEMEMLAG